MSEVSGPLVAEKAFDYSLEGLGSVSGVDLSIDEIAQWGDDPGVDAEVVAGAHDGVQCGAVQVQGLAGGGEVARVDGLWCTVRCSGRCRRG